MRVSQYLAFCLDGGLFGSKFTIATIISNMSKDTCSKDAEAKFADILAFILHLRPQDMKVSYELEDMEAQLQHFGLLARYGSHKVQVPCVFNDRVMQVLLEMGYIS